MKLLGKIWAIWAVIVFVFFMFIALPFYIIGIALWGSKAIQKINFISRIWAGSIFFFCGIRINRSGVKPNPKQPMVLISNHLSAIDIPLCAIVSAHAFKFLAKAELGKIPVLGWIIKNIYLTVDRSNKSARSKSLEKMKNAIEAGTSIFIYPEGTRNQTKEPLRNFHEGAFRLAIAAQVPIAILRLGNTQKLCPPTGFSLLPGKLESEWVDVIETKGMKVEESSALMETCKNKLQQTIERANE